MIAASSLVVQIVAVIVVVWVAAWFIALRGGDDRGRPVPTPATGDPIERHGIRAEEVRKVVEIVGCHQHVPGKLGGRMCKVCTMWPESPRHNGVAEVGKTSWGARVLPMREDAPNDDVSCWEVHA